MIAMLFSAGLGTRLAPLTNTSPKALVNCMGKPLLQHNIEQLIEAGVSKIVINVHHYSKQIIDFLKTNNNFGIEIHISDESNELLDTGGGLKKASNLLEAHSEIILRNTDVLSNIDYQDFLSFHREKNSMATLAVRHRETSRYLLINKESQLKGWKNTKSGETIHVNQDADQLQQVGFSGIHIISKNILKHFPKQNQFNIIQWYLQIAKKQPIYCYQHNQNYWFDIGTLAKLKEAENQLNTNK